MRALLFLLFLCLQSALAARNKNEADRLLAAALADTVEAFTAGVAAAGGTAGCTLITFSLGRYSIRP